MAGMKGRSGGRRPGAGRPRGSKSGQTKARDATMAEIERCLKFLVRQRQNEYESGPNILRRLTEIEKHLSLRERRPPTPRFSRGAPMGRESAAERLFTKPAASTPTEG